MEHTTLTRFAWLSIAAALATITLKTTAYFLTGSVGLLSDALESLVNLVAAIIALVILTIAARPPDEDHAYGHGKAEYFSSGVEGTLILVAAASIVAAAVPRLFVPQPIEQVGLGLVVSMVASAINLCVAIVLRRAGRHHHSITLEADAEHLLTDVWTSAGVLAAVGLVALTGWVWLDPVIALIVAANIVWAGVRLVRRSALGLMDTALPDQQRSAIRAIQERYQAQGIEFHALRTRQAAARAFVSMHVLVPGGWSVQRGHELLEQIEADVRRAVPNSTVFTHLEPLDDPVSWQDTQLEREEARAQAAAERSANQ
jgi:cation diffusion facilitator family transporter